MDQRRIPVRIWLPGFNAGGSGTLGNASAGGVVGAVIAGGGRRSGGIAEFNAVSDSYGVVGGEENVAGAYQELDPNPADTERVVDCSLLTDMMTGIYSTIGGGQSNVAGGRYSGILGGRSYTTSGNNTVIGGGQSNIAGGDHASVPGGGNTAAGRTALPRSIWPRPGQPGRSSGLTTASASALTAFPRRMPVLRAAP